MPPASWLRELLGFLVNIRPPPKQKGNAIEIAERWERWLADPDNNRPPNTKAVHPKYQATSAESMRERAWKGIKAISRERAKDPEPNRRHFPAAKAARASYSGSGPLWPLLWQHDQHEPIGGVMSATQDSHGLFITGQIDMSTDLGRRAYNGLKSGYMGGLSIGYFPVVVAAGALNDRMGRRVQKVDLIEISAVTLPANPLARITEIKTRQPAPDASLANLEHQLTMQTFELEQQRLTAAFRRMGG